MFRHRAILLLILKVGKKKDGLEKKWSKKMGTSKSSYNQKFTKRMQNAKIQDKTYLRVIIVSLKPEN